MTSRVNPYQAAFPNNPSSVDYLVQQASSLTLNEAAEVDPRWKDPEIFHLLRAIDWDGNSVACKSLAEHLQEGESIQLLNGTYVTKEDLLQSIIGTGLVAPFEDNSLFFYDEI